VRNVPTFPDRDIKPGESWKGTGEEAHDLRDTFGIEKPYKVPFEVTYTYIGPETKDGKTLHHIQAEYTLFYDSPDVRPVTGKGASGGDYPVTTMGYSKQQLYFDSVAGNMPYYTEEFRIQIQTESGTIFEFRGTAEATVTEETHLDKAQTVKDMNAEIAKLGITNATATATAEGVTISIENIQFDADSANLLPQEKEKIRRLAGILERYPDKDLLISGHTALAGTAASRQKLSEERAAAVARYLVEMGVRENYKVYTRGFGSDKPVAPNDTEANRARNRRVEITVLDK
jgi:outer membrane protein OmpA-like peptidoglycan-associated protein